MTSTSTTTEQHVIYHLTDEGLGQPGLFEAVCGCKKSVSTRNPTLLALWTRMHARYAGTGKCEQTSIYRLDSETAEICDTPRSCGHPDHLYAVVASCGQYWESPTRAIVEENKRTHKH